MIHSFEVKTSKKEEFIDITDQVRQVLQKTGLEDGLCLVFVAHTTASIVVTENATDLAEDIIEALGKIVPLPPQVEYRHKGDAPAHIKATLLGHSKTVIVESGALLLQKWQRIFLCEFVGPQNRKIQVKTIGAGR